jgi:hypothetical protein
VTPQLAVKAKRNKAGLSDGAVTGIGLGDLDSAEVVDISSINIDDAYQRALRHELVNRIGRDFDIVKAGPILLSAREDGSLWCVDGQHRMMGALQAGETEIFAHVVHGLTQAQEADLRLARNDRKGDSVQEKFRTRLVMGEEKVHRMVELVEQQHTMINVENPNIRHGVNAITTLEMLYDIDGTGVWMTRVIHTLREAYAVDDGDTLDPSTLSANMLKAVAWFLGQHVDPGELRYSDFVNRLASVDVDDIRRKAVSHKAANGGATWLNYYRAIVEIWNFKRSDSKKLRWKTIGSVAQLGSETPAHRHYAWGPRAS